MPGNEVVLRSLLRERTNRLLKGGGGGGGGGGGAWGGGGGGGGGCGGGGERERIWNVRGTYVHSMWKTSLKMPKRNVFFLFFIPINNFR